MPALKWSLEAVIADAQKYSSRSEWKRRSPIAYRKAIKLNVLKDILLGRLRISWTKDRCLEDASQYANKTQWQKFGSGYMIALRNGWLDECCTHMCRPAAHNKIWTRELIMKHAEDFTLLSEWTKTGAYKAAVSMGIMTECTGHMERARRSWDKESVIQDAKRFTTLTDWCLGSYSYQFAQKHNWIGASSLHMVAGTNSSKPEKYLLELVQSYYPQARKAFFGIKKGIGNSFELDIFIPELNKGIEFNGKYFHSLAGLKRSRPNWPDEMLKNYHEIKREFFALKGIEYVEIWEQDWVADKDRCLSAVLDFINPNLHRSSGEDS